MYQKLVIVGNLGSEPELRYMPDGGAVCNFSLASNRRYRDTDETTWFRVTVWGKQAESVSQFLHKGRQALVEGRLTPDDKGNPRIWTDNQGNARSSYEVTAERVVFLGGKVDERDELAVAEQDAIPF